MPLATNSTPGLLCLGDDPLDLEDIVLVARQRIVVAPLPAGAVAAMGASASWVARTVEEIVAARADNRQPKAYYGINTGFGALAGRTALDSRFLTELLGRNLIASHTVGVGPYFEEEVIRAVLLIRAQSLAQGRSGVRPVVVETLIRMLNAGVYPAAPELGSLGASGDLAPLAHIVLAMTAVPEPPPGETAPDPTDGEAFIPLDGPVPDDAVLHLTEDHATGAQKRWRKVSGARAMAVAGGKLRLQAKEALALLNGATVSAAIAALALMDAEHLLDHAELALAMTLEGARGFRDPFLPMPHGARGHAAAGQVGAHVLDYTRASTLLDPGDLGTDPVRVPPQDPYCLRCAPQVLGSVADALALARQWVEMDINAVTDNPLIFLDLPRDYKAISGGNFHGHPIALGMDFLSVALTGLASLSERRMFMLNDYRPGTPEGLPPFLAGAPAGATGLNSGLMMLQATAAALVSDCKTLAHPDSVDSIPSSGNQEDHVSMSLNAARHARQITRNVEQVLAMEMICAAQAIGLQMAKPDAGGLAPGHGVAAACHKLREAGIAPLTHDRVLYPDIRRAVRLLRDGSLLAAARAAAATP